MSENVETVVAKFCVTNRTVANAIWQFDRGLFLKFENVSLPQSFEVHFSNYESGTSEVYLGSRELGVEIPYKFTMSGLPVYAWVYVSPSQNVGLTKYLVMIPVMARAYPYAEEPTPEEYEIIAELIAKLDAGVEDAEASAQAAADSLEALQNMGVQAQTLSPGSEATAEKTVDPETGEVTLDFGIPQGVQGERGPQGDPGEVTLEQLYSVYPVDTASAEIGPVSFVDGADDIPIKSLSASFLPAQDLSPFNMVWPAGGGKNKLPYLTQRGLEEANVVGTWDKYDYTLNGFTFSAKYDLQGNLSYVTVTGDEQGYSAQFVISPDFSLPDGEYVISYFGTNEFYLSLYKNGAEIAASSGEVTVSVVSTDILYMEVVASNKAHGPFTVYPMIRPVSVVDSSFAPYEFVSEIPFFDSAEVEVSGGQEVTPVSYQIDFGRSIAGGTLDPVNGLLTITDVCYTLNGTEGFFSSGGNRFLQTFSNLGWPVCDADFAEAAISSHFDFKTNAQGGNEWGKFRIATNNLVFGALNSPFVDAAAFNSWLAAQYAKRKAVEIRYKLAEPLTYNLTPQEIKTFLGANVVGAEAGGQSADSISVEYRADVALYVQKMIQEALGE